MKNTQPIAEIMRPKSLEDVVGQDHLTKDKGLLRRLIHNQSPASILLFGPPGSGKTSIARLYAQAFDLEFFHFSAVTDKIAEIKKLLKEGKSTPLFHRKKILFIDEIHRLNTAGQDIFLPFIEEGSTILIGATTENPSFVMNNALLSRLRVLELYPLSESALSQILDHFSAIVAIKFQPKVRDYLIERSNGDARNLINILEDIAQFYDGEVCSISDIEHLRQKAIANYDKNGEYHYNLISALHKAVRGSDPDAALYWLARMIAGGEDPNFLFRRLTRMASEDIGLADPYALQFIVSRWEAFQRIGSPEGELMMAEAVVYLSLAPKSNRIYTSFKLMQDFAKKSSQFPPPKSILNAPTQEMQERGYGKGYIYDHDTKEAFSGQNYFPEGMQRIKTYFPQTRGFENELKRRLEILERLRQKKEPSDSSA